MKIFIKIIIVLLLCNINAFAQTFTPSLFENAEYKYSMLLPKEWKTEIPMEEYHVVRCEYRIDSNVQADMNFKIMIMQGGTREEALKSFLKIYNMFYKDIKEIKEEAISINGKECIWKEISYKEKKSTNNSRYEIICVYERNNTVLKISFSGLEELYLKNKELVLNCLKSFKYE